MSQEHKAGWFTADSCRLDDFIETVAVVSEVDEFPHASSLAQGTVVYRSDDLRKVISDPDTRGVVMAEMARLLSDGPGILMLEGALEVDVVDRAAAVFEQIIGEERASGNVAGDHYAKPGANDRVWNALEKLALADPGVFVDYYSNDMIALASEAWLGPGYQVTSQINVVNPGGEAQQPHRDYHLGFLTDEQALQFPSHVHGVSPMLTLQGAVAHCDMSVESGPTMYLPHSQKYGPGYLAWRRPEFREYFADNHVQLPLKSGDAVFFNPALFHAAGTNRTNDVRRMANLLQVSSAFGRAMESIDRHAMCLMLYPALVERRDAGVDPCVLDRAIAASAEGYPFPTNLDRDQPIGGLAPPSQADVIRTALAEGWSLNRLDDALSDHASRRSTI